jgi:hypothetical protein
MYMLLRLGQLEQVSPTQGEDRCGSRTAVVIAGAAHTTISNLLNPQDNCRRACFDAKSVLAIDGAALDAALAKGEPRHVPHEY